MTTNDTFEDRLLRQLRTVVAANDAPPTRTAHRVPGRLVMIGAGAAAATAAAAIVMVANGGGSPAYALDAQPDGSVTVHINSLRDASGLQSSLRQAGIPAVVSYEAFCDPTTALAPEGSGTSGQRSGESTHVDTGGPALSTAGGTQLGRSSDAAGGKVTRGVAHPPRVTSSVAVDRTGATTFTLDPGHIAPGEKVYITTSTAASSTGMANAISVAIAAKAPVGGGCVAAPPARP